MIDQASALRALVRDKTAHHSELESLDLPDRPYTLAVTSGKGGVGKTSLAVNLSLLLGRIGRRVWLVDADFGLANAEVLLGIAPDFSIADVLNGKVDLADAWCDVDNGVKLLSSGSGLEDVANIGGTEAVSLIRRVQERANPEDLVVVDIGPGIDGPVMPILTIADEVVVVTTPEPTALTDSYALMKILFGHSAESNVTLVINCCESPSQASSLASSLDSICRKFLNNSFRRYEYMPMDESVGASIRLQKPIVATFRRSRVEPWLRRFAFKVDERVRARQYGARFPKLEIKNACCPGISPASTS